MRRKGVGFLLAEDVEEVVILGWDRSEEFHAFFVVRIGGRGGSDGRRRVQSVLDVDDRGMEAITTRRGGESVRIDEFDVDSRNGGS